MGTYAIIDFAVRDTRETEHSNVRVAQLDRASGYGPEGREFESSSARQNRKPAVKRVFLCLCGFAGCLYSILMYANIVKILK